MEDKIIFENVEAFGMKSIMVDIFSIPEERFKGIRFSDIGVVLVSHVFDDEGTLYVVAKSKEYKQQIQQVVENNPTKIAVAFFNMLTALKSNIEHFELTKENDC